MKNKDKQFWETAFFSWLRRPVYQLISISNLSAGEEVCKSDCELLLCGISPRNVANIGRYQTLERVEFPNTFACDSFFRNFHCSVLSQCDSLSRPHFFPFSTFLPRLPIESTRLNVFERLKYVKNLELLILKCLWMIPKPTLLLKFTILTTLMCCWWNGTVFFIKKNDWLH